MHVTFWNSTGWIFSLYPECPSDQPLHWDFWELLVWCTCKCQVSPYARSIFTQVVIFHSQWTNRIQRAVSAHVTVLSLLVKALQSDVRRSDLDLQHSFLKCHPHFFFFTDTHFVLVSCRGVFLKPWAPDARPFFKKEQEVMYSKCCPLCTHTKMKYVSFALQEKYSKTVILWKFV